LGQELTARNGVGKNQTRQVTKVNARATPSVFSRVDGGIGSSSRMCRCTSSKPERNRCAGSKVAFAFAPCQRNHAAIAYLLRIVVSKESELFYLERFKENFSNFPQGDICPDESPDFLVKSGNGIIGVELTDFYRQVSSETPLPLQAREKVRQRIISQAKSIYDESGFAPVWAFAYFDGNFQCRASEIQSVAERLVQLAKCSLLEQENEKNWARDDIQINGIHSLSVKRSIMAKSYWRAPLATFVPEVKPQQLQKILDKKSALSEDYRRKCKKVWLVIVMDRFRASSFSLIPEGFAEHAFSHKFDSAFLFSHDYSDAQSPPILLRKS